MYFLLVSEGSDSGVKLDDSISSPSVGIFNGFLGLGNPHRLGLFWSHQQWFGTEVPNLLLEPSCTWHDQSIDEGI